MLRNFSKMKEATFYSQLQGIMDNRRRKNLFWKIILIKMFRNNIWIYSKENPVSNWIIMNHSQIIKSIMKRINPKKIILNYKNLTNRTNHII